MAQAPIKYFRTTLPAGGGNQDLGNATQFQGNPISAADPEDQDIWVWSAALNEWVLQTLPPAEGITGLDCNNTNGIAFSTGSLFAIDCAYDGTLGTLDCENYVTT